MYNRLINTIRLQGSALKKHLESIVNRSILAKPQLLTAEMKMSIDLVIDRLNDAIKQYIYEYRKRCSDLISRLKNLNPCDVLSRGYSVTNRMRDGKILTDSKDVDPGEYVKTTLHTGGIVCEVNERE